MTNRPLRDIAADIEAHWPQVNYAARPYLDAMAELDEITDNYYLDTAESVVLYFLANARAWRGGDARRIKTELRSMIDRIDHHDAN
jgi:hypothetical protein